MRKCASARDDRICNENQSVERRPLSANAFRRCRLKPLDEWRKKKESTCVRARYWSYATRYTAPAPLQAQRRADYVHAPFSHDISRDTCFSWFAFGLSVESSRWRWRANLIKISNDRVLRWTEGLECNARWRDIFCLEYVSKPRVAFIPAARKFKSARIIRNVQAFRISHSLLYRGQMKSGFHQTYFSMQSFSLNAVIHFA